jgi:hypothetical protein
MGKDSTYHILMYVLYVMYFSIPKEAVFDWDEIILNEISYQLVNYLKTSRFLMTAYLVLVVAYCNVFERLTSRGNFDAKKEPIQFWYPIL